MAFAIILLETFAVYLMIMTSIHTDILAMRLTRLREDEEVKALDETENYLRDQSLLIECFQMYAANAR